MKKLAYAVLGCLFLTIFSCSSQNNVTSPEELSNLITTNQFTFMAEKANPTNYDVIRVMNSMPNSTATRVLNLDRGYTVVIKENLVEADLPYFGRLYNPSYDTSKNGIKFTSKKFNVDKTTSKKGNTIYTIKIGDVSQMNTLYLEVYKSGRAFLSVDANDRQPITYDGYIMKNVEVKN